MTEERDSSERAIRVIPFKGTDSEEFMMWSLKFMAGAAVKGYDEILEGALVPVEDGREMYTEEVRNKRKNAYNDLVLSMDGKSCFKIVKTVMLLRDYTNIGAILTHSRSFLLKNAHSL